MHKKYQINFSYLLQLSRADLSVDKAGMTNDDVTKFIESTKNVKKCNIIQCNEKIKKTHLY